MEKLKFGSYIITKDNWEKFIFDQSNWSTNVRPGCDCGCGGNCWEPEFDEVEKPSMYYWDIDTWEDLVKVHQEYFHKNGDIDETAEQKCIDKYNKELKEEKALRDAKYEELKEIEEINKIW